LIRPRPPTPARFPYTTLFRSVVKKIAIDGQTHVDFVLEPAVSELSELVVTGVAQATELKESPVIIKPIGADVLQGQSNLNLIDADRKSTRLNSSHVKISYAVF